VNKRFDAKKAQEPFKARPKSNYGPKVSSGSGGAVGAAALAAKQD